MSKRNNFRIGVVGYNHPTKFNYEKAWHLTQKGIDDALFVAESKFDSINRITIVGGLSDIPAIYRIGYYIARQNGWRCGGVACSKANDFAWWPMSEWGDTLKIVGHNWGDESEDFVDSLDALVRVGGGPQSKKETKMAKERGIPVYEYELESE